MTRDRFSPSRRQKRYRELKRAGKKCWRLYIPEDFPQYLGSELQTFTDTVIIDLMDAWKKAEFERKFHAYLLYLMQNPKKVSPKEFIANFMAPLEENESRVSVFMNDRFERLEIQGALSESDLLRVRDHMQKK